MSSAEFFTQSVKHLIPLDKSEAVSAIADTTFLISAHKRMYCGYSLKATSRWAPKQYQQHIFGEGIKKIHYSC